MIGINRGRSIGVGMEGSSEPSKGERLAIAKSELDEARKRFATVCQRYIEVSQAHTDAEMEVLTASRRVRQIEAEP